MKNKLDCCIVEDLLPLYVEALVSEDTKKQIEEHLETCDQCQQKLLSMQSDDEKSHDTIRDIDYLKTIRKKTTKQKWIALWSGIFIVMLIGFGFYFKGNETTYDQLDYQIQVDDQNHLYLQLKSKSASQTIVRVKKTYQNGQVWLKVYTSPSFFVNNQYKTYEFNNSSHVEQVLLGNAVLWQNDQTLSAKVNALYEAKNPYIGDFSSDLRLANILEIEKQFGIFKNELQTDTIPYGWSIYLNSPLTLQNQDYQLEKIKRYSYVLIALIDNLDSITWHYTLDHQDLTCVISKEDASTFCKQDIKSFSQSVYDVASLLDLLKINE